MQARKGFRELCEFVVVGGEEGAGTAGLVGVEVLDNGPCDGEAVVGAGAAANFVENDEAAGGRIVEDVGGLVHLDHEGGVAACEFVAGADAGEDAINEAEATVARGHPRAGLGHENNEGYLTNVGGLAGHVGAGDEGDLRGFLSSGGSELAVVGDEGMGAGEAEGLAAHHLFDDGVATLVDFEAVGGVDFRAAVVPLAGEAGPASENIDFGEGIRSLAEVVCPCEDSGD